MSVFERQRMRDELRAAFAAAAIEMRFVCRKRKWCAGIAQAGWRVVTLDDPAYLGTACDSADFVIAPQFLRTHSCRSGAVLFTARSLRQTGALEIRPSSDHAGTANKTGYAIDKAVTTLDRPWARHRLYDWRSNEFVAPDSATVTDIGG